MNLTEFLDAPSTLEMTRTCVGLYLALPRNCAMSIEVWRRYLSEDRYLGNRLTFEIGKTLVESDQVSRSNYKLILAVLLQKNGFMKITKLKTLMTVGKLASPILPHKGKWRCLIRLDQFALKRATLEGIAQDENKPANTLSTESFICRIAGNKSKLPLLKQYLSKHLNSSPSLSPLVSRCLSSGNISGLSDIPHLSQNQLHCGGSVDSVIPTIKSHRNLLGDNIFHILIRDSRCVDKVRVISNLLVIPSLCQLLNEVNLTNQTPLVLAFSSGMPELCKLFKTHGADTSICDNRGIYYIEN